MLVAAPRLFLPRPGTQGSCCNFRHHLQITKFKCPIFQNEEKACRILPFLPWPEMLVKAYSHNGDALVGSDTSSLPAGMGVPWFFILASTPRVLCMSLPHTQIYTGNGSGVLCVPPTIHRYMHTEGIMGSYVHPPHLIGIPAITGTLGAHRRKCV